MNFYHSESVLTRFPTLRTVSLRVWDFDPSLSSHLDAEPHLNSALARLSHSTEGEWTSIKSWRAAYAQMGYKPTQYRCAAEALLRRLRQREGLPALNPVVDYCNAVSAAFGIPLAAFDLNYVYGDLIVVPAQGSERFETFGGQIEHPNPGEIIFRDQAHRAHARRWAHRQGAYSAIKASSRQILLVAEALHESAAMHLEQMRVTLEQGFGQCSRRTSPLIAAEDVGLK